MKPLLIFVLTLVSFSIFPQKNASKASFFPESKYNMFGFAQERALSKRISVQTTFKFMPETKIEEAKYAAGSFKTEGSNPFSDTKVNAFGNVTELRIYSKKRGAMRGVYWGPYFSATAYNISTANYIARFKINYNYSYEAELQQSARVATAGGGLQFGLQGLIKKRIAIDWTILGIGICSGSLNGRIQLVNAPEEVDLRNFPVDMGKSEFAFEKYYPLKKTVEAKSISVSGKGLLPMLRTSLSIGIAY
jgi:hypothetical protein